MRSPNRRHDLPLLNKYTSAQTAKAVLRTSSLRWSSPLLFNDPFDVPREMGLPFTAADLREATIARIKEYTTGGATPAPGTVYASIGGVSKEALERQKLMAAIVEENSHLLTTPTEIAVHEFETSWREKVRVLRILCLSAVSDSPAMWTHYADEHRGVVLEFESSDERDSVFVISSPVIYQADPPRLPRLDRWVRAFLEEDEIDWDEYF